ncbi:hypothetical protein C0J52_25734 [Blattella germanica]|nr:hypothetical protein C0J52_25734 [Blattella germanica]
MIDYILMETQEEKLHLIGYSMGTTMFYVMGSERPEYNNKIKAMYSMAPIAFISHTKSPLLRLAAEFETLSWVFLELMGGMEFLPKSELISMLGTELCQEESISSELCLNIIFLTCGYDSVELDKDVDELYKKLGNPIGKFLVPFKKFNHLDYMWAKHAPQLVYNDIIALMNKTESH